MKTATLPPELDSALKMTPVEPVPYLIQPGTSTRF